MKKSNKRRRTSSTLIKKTFGSKRADLIIQYCLEHNLRGIDDEVDELAYNKEW